MFKKLAAGTALLGLVLFYVVASHTRPIFHLSDLPIYLTLLALYAFTEFFPLKRGQLTISLSMSVDLLIFVKFGIVPIMVASQLLFVSSRWYREKKLEFWRTIANMGMFLLATSGASGAFYVAGGVNVPELKNGNLLAILAYICVYFLINHSCLYLFFKALRKMTIRSYIHMMRFDLFSTLFACSLGLIVILLYKSNGTIGLLSYGFPMVLCVYVFRLFNDVSRSSGLFRNLANLTGDFSGELEVSTLCSRVTEELPKWFNDTHCVIFVRQGCELSLLSVSADCPQEAVDALWHYIQSDEQKFEQPSLVRRLRESAEFASLPYHVLLVAPFHSDQNEHGFCCLLANGFNEFDATTLDAVSVLANQLTVSIRNAMRYESVEKQSLYDELTQLPNHRFCERRLSEEIIRFENNTSLSLLLIDLDHFKKVNDQYGHQAGNVVLSTIARTFELCIRKSDFVARYGGEEFMVVLPGAGAELALQIGEKIRANVENMEVPVPTMEGDTKMIKLTVSIGIATFPQHAGDAQQLVRYADRAMYHGAKRAGRNRLPYTKKKTTNKNKTASVEEAVLFSYFAFDLITT